MKYLVSLEGIDGGPTMSPQAVARMVETQVLPSLEALKKLEADGKILGGASAGQRRMIFIAKAKDNAEIDKLVKSLPVWGITKVEVTALNSFEERHASDKALAAHMKQAG